MDLANLIKSNFWLLSVKNISTVIDINFLKFISKMQEKMPGISEHSILMSLEELARENGRVSTVLEMLVATDLRGCARGARTP